LFAAHPCTVRLMDDELRRALAEADAIHAGEARRQRRRKAIAELIGSLTGVYEPGYIDALRQDWPD